MFIILLYILIPNLFSFLFLFSSKNETGSDHAYHVRLITAIKRNKNRFVEISPITLNEKKFPYPQLFHWTLSFLPEKIYREKHAYIAIVVKLLEIVAFNSFLFFLHKNESFDSIFILYANIVVNIFPISYASWNAKNMGLSARGIGLVAGHIYTYLIVAYIMTSNVFLLIPLFFVNFIIIILSQMALQFLLLTLPFLAYFFKIPEILILPFIAFALFYTLKPEVAKNFIIAQYNHKRNYALFMAELFILKIRPSIYRDFVFDFWVNFKKNIVKGAAYIYSNPIVEIVYGIPFLWFILYSFVKSELSPNLTILTYVILSSCFAFILTSFRKTRFLGEPQRYIEFTIPLIAVVFVMNFSTIYILYLIAFSVVMISFSFIILRLDAKGKAVQKNRNALIDYLTQNSQFTNAKCISNDHDLLKCFLPFDINIIKPDLTCFHKEKKDFNCNFYLGNYNVLSFSALKNYIHHYGANLLIINNRFYSFNDLKNNIDSDDFCHLIDIHEYSVYKIINI